MIKNAHEKGRRAERELELWLKEELGEEFVVRNFDQNREGGADIIIDGKIAVQVKHCETKSLGSWYQQAKRDAGEDYIPAVAWKQNRRGWTFFVHVADMMCSSVIEQQRVKMQLAQLDKECFIYFLREKL